MKGEGCHLVGFFYTFDFGETVAPNATAQRFSRARTEVSLLILPLKLSRRETCCFDSM